MTPSNNNTGPAMTDEYDVEVIDTEIIVTQREPDAKKNTEQEVLDKFATELWHIGVQIGQHVTDQHPIWLEGESGRRRMALMDIRFQLDATREALMRIAREAN